MPATPTIAVLAGGPSTRFGSHKPNALLAGLTMLDWVLRAAGGMPTIVVGGPEVAGSRWVPDEVRDGPAGALALAIAAAGGPVILVGADQPWVRPATLEALAAFPAEAACVPVDGDSRQVTCARYPATLADLAARTSAAGGGLQRVLDMVPRNEVPEERWRTWGEDGRSWYSVDSLEHLTEGLTRYGPPG